MCYYNYNNKTRSPSLVIVFPTAARTDGRKVRRAFTYESATQCTSTGGGTHDSACAQQGSSDIAVQRLALKSLEGQIVCLIVRDVWTTIGVGRWRRILFPTNNLQAQANNGTQATRNWTEGTSDRARPAIIWAWEISGRNLTQNDGRMKTNYGEIAVRSLSTLLQAYFGLLTAEVAPILQVSRKGRLTASIVIGCNRSEETSR